MSRERHRRGALLVSDVKTQLTHPGGQPIARGHDLCPVFLKPRLVVDGRGGAGDRQGVAIVGILDLEQLLYDLWLSDQEAELAAAVCGSLPDLGRLWPVLDTISCWTSGSAGQFLAICGAP